MSKEYHNTNLTSTRQRLPGLPVVVEAVVA